MDAIDTGGGLRADLSRDAPVRARRVSALPEQPSVVVEGPQVLPDLLPTGAKAVFLIPTLGFQRSVLSPRPMPSSDPQRALEARLVKDRLYADRVAALARERGFRVINVDGSQAPDEVQAQVEDEFADLLHASEPRELGDVRRWENENMARNLRAWASSGDVRTSTEIAFPFACECGRLGCDARVSLTLPQIQAPSWRILAPGHPVSDA